MVDRAGAAARRLAPLAALAVVAFLAWTLVNQGNHGGVQVVSAILAVAATALVATVPFLLARASSSHREATPVGAGTRAGWAFGVSAAAIALVFCALFADLFPNALPSTISAANDLTLRDAASTSYTLTVMTVVAGLLVPVVLVYQAWTYWVFRARLGRADFEEVRGPVDVVAKVTGGPGSARPGKPPAGVGGS